MIKRKKNNKPYIYCTNCGKKGHEYKICKEPIISIGIILLKFDKDVKNVLTKRPTTPVDINSSNSMVGIMVNDTNDLNTFSKIKDSISFLMIQRKHTLGYIEFIRGRYKPDNFDGIIFLFQQMTKEEIDKIAVSSFSELWDDFWGSSDRKQMFGQEYIKSSEKFYILKDNKIDLGLEYYTKNVKPTWRQSEWGFPKGRRNKNEDNLECGIREFQEESGFKKIDISLVDGIEPLVEDFIGTNGIRYKHIYYIATATNNRIPIVDKNDFIQNSEVGAIEYVSYDTALKIIRPYHTARKNLLTKLYNYVINKIMCDTDK